MAQYWEDWSGSTLGSAPTGWTDSFVVGGATWTVEADTSGHAPAGRRVTYVKSALDRSFLAFDAVGSTHDRVQVCALVRQTTTSSTSSTYGGVAGRGSGGTGTESVVHASLGNSTGTENIRVTQINAGSSSQIATGAVANSWDTAGYYWVTLDLNGATATYTIASVATPGTAIDTGTVTVAVTSAGKVGLFGVAVATDMHILAVGVGTDGDAAPTSDPATVTVRGAAVTLYNGSTARASVTGITARWWDSATATGAPLVKTDTASTDATGLLKLNIDSATALPVGGVGYLSLYKAGADPQSDLHFASRITVSDIG